MKKHVSGLALQQHILHALLAAIAFGLMSETAIKGVGHLSKSVGEAILIALLVIYLVEVQSHKRLEESAIQMIKKVGKNIFGLVYGHELPSRFVEALEKTMLEQPVYRESMHLAVELTSTELTNSAGVNEKLCKMHCTFSFTLMNCSDAPAKQPIQVALERDKWLAELYPDNASEPFLEYLRINNDLYVRPEDAEKVKRQLTAVDLKIKPLTDLGTDKSDGNELVFCQPDTIIPAKGSVQVKFGGVMYKRYSDNEVWSTFFPTLAVFLTVTSVDFEVEARFPTSGEVLSTNLGDTTSRWEYDAPLMSGQSVIYWWRPKKR